MKRYRVLAFDFDMRVNLLKTCYDKRELTELEEVNRGKLILGFRHQYGENNFDQKLKNLLEIGSKSFSVIAYHNNFLEQIRNSFVIGSFYPALIGSCALGERILNHLILNLRDHFKGTNEFKKVQRKRSFDNWELVIETLEKWEMLLPKTVEMLLRLKDKRNRSIHFNIETENNDRQNALEAVTLIQEIINEQFTAFGDRPWFILNIPGEIYIKQSWQENPFVKLIYLPNSMFLGHAHKVLSLNPYKIDDNFNYEQKEISDEEFATLRNQFYN